MESYSNIPAGIFLMKRFVKKKKKIIHEKEQKRSELVPFHFFVILVCMLPALLSGL